MITAEVNTEEYYRQLISEASVGTGELVRLWIVTAYKTRTDEYFIHRNSVVRGLVVQSKRISGGGVQTLVLFKRWPLLMTCKQRLRELAQRCCLEVSR